MFLLFLILQQSPKFHIRSDTFCSPANMVTLTIHPNKVENRKKDR